MESKRLRVRRLYEDIIELVGVTWHFTAEEFVAFDYFFRETLANGSYRFNMEWESGDINTVAFLEPKYTISHSDNLYAISATLQLFPLNEVESGALGPGESGDESGGGPGESGVPDEGSSGLGDESFGGSGDVGGESGVGGEESGGGGGGGDESDGLPDPPPLLPYDPPPEEWPGSGLWGPLWVTDEDEDSGYVGIPDTEDLPGYVNANGPPGCLDAWVLALWQDFLTFGPAYSDARIRWAFVNVTGLNFNAIHVFPSQTGSYPQMLGIDWSPVVEYIAL